MGRPRVLDEGKQREVCALLTAGMTVGEAAAYVGCCEKTIRREQRRDEGFDERVRHARMAARLGPLQAVRQAAATHWRAAAWLVDRQDRQEERERRARRERAKRKQQRERAKSRRPPQPWNLEQEIEQIAAARPPAGSKAMRRTKPPLRLADEPAAEPVIEGRSGSGGDPDARGFVPSLRLFGQNEAVAPNAGEQVDPVRGANPTASAVGCGEDRRRLVRVSRRSGSRGSQTC